MIPVEASAPGPVFHGLRTRYLATSPCGSIRSGRKERPCARSPGRSQKSGLRAGRCGARYLCVALVADPPPAATEIPNHLLDSRLSLS